MQAYFASAREARPVSTGKSFPVGASAKPGEDQCCAARDGWYNDVGQVIWLNLQTQYDFEVQKDKLDKQFEEEVKVLEKSA